MILPHPLAPQLHKISYIVCNCLIIYLLTAISPIQYSYLLFLSPTIFVNFFIPLLGQITVNICTFAPVTYLYIYIDALFSSILYILLTGWVFILIRNRFFCTLCIYTLFVVLYTVPCSLFSMKYLNKEKKWFLYPHKWSWCRNPPHCATAFWQQDTSRLQPLIDKGFPCQTEVSTHGSNSSQFLLNLPNVVSSMANLSVAHS